MTRLAAFAAAALSTAAFAGPEVKIDCPAGMHFVQNKGCVANLAPKVDCPGGTHFEGGKCIAIIDTSCPAGMHFVTGTGCVAGSARAGRVSPQQPAEAPPSPPERPAQEATGKKKGGTFSGGLFSDRLEANCAGLPIEVHGGSRLTGVRAMLMVDGRKMGEEQEVDVGQTRNISGTFGKQEVDLKIQQGLWGTRYTLRVDGVECKLSK